MCPQILGTLQGCDLALLRCSLCANGRVSDISLAKTWFTATELPSECKDSYIIDSALLLIQWFLVCRLFFPKLYLYILLKVPMSRKSFVLDGVVQPATPVTANQWAGATECAAPNKPRRGYSLSCSYPALHRWDTMGRQKAKRACHEGDEFTKRTIGYPH